MEKKLKMRKKNKEIIDEEEEEEISSDKSQKKCLEKKRNRNNRKKCRYCNVKFCPSSLYKHIRRAHLDLLSNEIKVKEYAKICTKEINEVFEKIYDIKLLSDFVNSNMKDPLNNEKWFLQYKERMEKLRDLNLKTKVEDISYISFESDEDIQ